MIEIMSASLGTSRFGTSTPSVVGAGSSPGSSSRYRVPGEGYFVDGWIDHADHAGREGIGKFYVVS
jgi:hypothetical protein